MIEEHAKILKDEEAKPEQIEKNIPIIEKKLRNAKEEQKRIFREIQPLLAIEEKAKIALEQHANFFIKICSQDLTAEKYETFIKLHKMNLQAGKETKPTEILTLNEPLNIGNFIQKYTENLKKYFGCTYSYMPSERTQLIYDLENYIDRIESHQNKKYETDFSHGFWFLTTSRSFNREANFILAKHLLNELTNTTNPIEQIFSKIDDTRHTIVQNNPDHSPLLARPGYAERGIRSSELNAIIKKAHKFTNSQQPVTQKESEEGKEPENEGTSGLNL